MTAVFSAERLRELDTILGPDQRQTLLAALAAQAADARLALRRLHATGEHRLLLRDVHRLKGAAEIVGAASLIEALQDIEQAPPGEIPQALLDTADTRIAAVIDAATALATSSG